MQKGLETQQSQNNNQKKTCKGEWKLIDHKRTITEKDAKVRRNLLVTKQ